MLLNPSEARQAWIEAATLALRERFEYAGYTMPEAVRVSVGWPKRGAQCNGVGECWSPEAADDKHTEIFVSPELVDGKDIVAALAHLLSHAIVGRDQGHKVAFKRCARAVGLEGAMRGATPSHEFGEWIDELVERLDFYPAGHLTDNPKHKQPARMRLCECDVAGHGYSVRTTRKWIDADGPPWCPVHKVPMTVKS